MSAVTCSLYAHQQRGAEAALAAFAGGRQGYALLYEQGTGKTLTAVEIMGQMYLAGQITRALIVAPSSVCPVWPQEFDRYAAFPHDVRVLTGEGDKRRKTISDMIAADRNQYVPDKRLRALVVNYESTWRLEDALRAWDADIIVCDESQRIKKDTAKQSKAMHRLGDRAKYHMCLTGTPIQNNPLDVWSQYRFLDPTVFGLKFYPFKMHYAVMGGMRVNNHAVQVVAYKNLDELTEKMYCCAMRVTKAECLDLPDKVFTTVPVYLSRAERKIYDGMAKESVAWLDEQTNVTAAIVLTRLMRLQQITGGFIRPDGGGAAMQVGSAKLDALRDIITDTVVEGREKAVIFARFIPEVTAICALLDVQKVAYVALWGGVALKDRGALVDHFQTDPDTMVFVSQCDAGKEGLTLTAARTMIYYSLDFNYATYAQSQDRIHRIGQDSKCTYIRLIAQDTIDAKVLKTLEDKKSMADRIVDGYRDLFN